MEATPSTPPPSPSTPPPPASIPVRIWRWLARQSTGIACALVASVLLGFGSFYMDRRASQYESLSMDDLRFFFSPWRLEHAWFYGLAIALAVWGASTFACTWDSLSTRFRRRVKTFSMYGAPLVHIAFLLALLAHLWGGFTATNARHVVGPEGAVIDGVNYRPVRLDEDLQPNGMPRTVTVTFERTSNGVRDEAALGYNHPLTARLGASQLLLGRYEMTTDGVIIRHGGAQGIVRLGGPALIGGARVALRQYYDPRESTSLRVPVVEVDVDGEPAMLAMDPESREDTAFIGLHETPVVMLIERKNPSVPLVLLACAVAILGVVLTSMERVRTTRRSGAG